MNVGFWCFLITDALDAGKTMLKYLDQRSHTSQSWAWMLLLLLSFLLSSFAEASIFLSRPDTNGAIASESKICSQIGIDLLRSGGNAADALVGTTLCVGVIGMYHSGIGGGGFMLIRTGDGKYESIDFRETAPAAAFQDMYENFTIGSIIGGLASGVPGEIKGLEYLHQKYGVLPWMEVCMPAVRVAERGFPVTEDLFKMMNYAMTEADGFLVNDPNWAEDFAPDGELVGLGKTITRKRYAKTLYTIAREGSKAFYEGPIAESMIKAVQAANGTMTLEDLAKYEVSVRDAIQIDYRGYRMFSTPAPSSGTVALSTFKTIEGYNMSLSEDLKLNTHRLDEAIRFAYGAHNELGDPAFVDGQDDFEASMLNGTNAEQIRRKISDDRTLKVSEYNPKRLSSPETHGTSHVVTADASGMSITLTTTINLLFGSQVMVTETGIIMNNEMNDFSIPGVSNAFGFVPCPSNFIRPGKRPLSSITPVIVEYPSGDLFLSTGAAGGSRIITATIQTLWHALDHGMSMAESLAQPRLHDQLLPNEVVFEWTYDNSTVESMIEKGHNVLWTGAVLSSAQGIRRMRDGRFEAAGEPRQRNSGGLTT